MSQVQLKKDTKHLHDEIERIMYTKEIMDGSLSLVQYKHLVITNYRVTRCYEQAIGNDMSPQLAGRLEIHKRSKLTTLVEDLKDLGIDFQQLTFHPASLTALNDDFILGCLYVLEGATLGGHVIFKRLVSNPQLAHLHLNFHYYQVYGERLIPNWNQLVLELNQKSVQGYETILSGAQFIYNEYIRLHNGMSTQ